MGNGCRWTLNDLPANVRSQVLAKLSPDREPACPQPADTRPGPNKTEAAYRARVLAGKDARYEAITFRLANGHRYTPDWVVFEAGRPVECHEVKGAYRFGSHGRSRLAFDQARVEFPGLRWVWGAPLGSPRGGARVQGRNAPILHNSEVKP